MKILFLSDVHNSKRDWWKVVDVFDSEEYDLILSAGDWDYVPVDFKKYDVYTVYGNHDDVDVLKKRTLLLNDLSAPAGASVEEIEGLVVCSLGGAVVRDNFSYPETWHTPDDYLHGYFKILEELRNEYGRCDVLITHDSPGAVIEYEKVKLPRIDADAVDPKSYRRVFDLVADLLGPRLYLCGHVHSTSVTVTTINRFDVYGPSSNAPVVKNIFKSGGYYTVIDLSSKSVEVKKYTGELVKTVKLGTKVVF